MPVTYKPVPGKFRTRVTVSNRGDVVRTHKAQYRIFSDESPWSSDALVAFVALSGFQEFTALESDPTAFLRVLDVNAELSKEPYTFLADLEWSTETPDAQQADRENDDPFDDAPEFEIDGDVTTFPLWRDLNNKLIANAAGEPITGMEQERNVEIVRITRNEHLYDAAKCRRFRGAVNLYTFFGADPDTVRIRSIGVKRQFRKQIEFWPHTYELAYREDGWQPSILNSGLYQLDGGKRVACTDKHGEPVCEPVPIDDLGVQIEASALPDAAVFNDFVTIQRRDLSELNLPIPGGG